MNRFWIGVLPILWVLCERSLAEISNQDAKTGRISIQAKNDQIDTDRIQIFYDKRKNLMAYKNLKNKSCFLESVTGSEKPGIHKISRVQEKRIRSFKVPQSGLGRAKVKKLAGKKILKFCEGFRTNFVKDVLENRKDSMRQESEKENIFELFGGNLEKDKGAREKRQIRPRFRGQTQSQFMSFGDGKGSAEAVSQPDISKTIVSGVNGIGQAQSQSGGRDCDGCYPDGGGAAGRRFETGRETGRPGGETRGAGRGVETGDSNRGIPGRDGSQTFDGGRGIPRGGGAQTPEGSRGIPGQDGVRSRDGSNGIPEPGGGPGSSTTINEGKDFTIGSGRTPAGQGRGTSVDSGVSGGRDFPPGTPGRGRGSDSGLSGSSQGGQGGAGEFLGPGGHPHYPTQPNGGRFTPSSHGSDFSRTNGRDGGTTIPSQGETGARYPPSASSRPQSPTENGEARGRFPPSAASRPGNGLRYPPSASSRPYSPVGGDSNGRFPPSSSSKPVSGDRHPVTGGQYPPSASSRPYSPAGGDEHGRFPPSSSGKPSSEGRHPSNGSRYPPSASSRPYPPTGGETHGRFPPSASSKPASEDRRPVNGARYPPSASSRPYSPVGGESNARFPVSASSKPSSQDHRPGSAHFPPSSHSGGPPYSHGTNGRFPSETDEHASQRPLRPADHGPSYKYPPSSYAKPDADQNYGTRPRLPPSESDLRPPARYPPSSSSKPYYPGSSHESDRGSTPGSVPSTDGHGPQNGFRPRYPPSAFSKPLQPDYYPPSSGTRFRPQDTGGRFYPGGSGGQKHPQYEAGRPGSNYGETEVPCETDITGSTDGAGSHPGGFPLGGHGQEGQGGKYDKDFHLGSPSRPGLSGGGRSDIVPGASGAGYPSGTGDHRPSTFDRGYPSSRPDTWGPAYPSQVDRGHGETIRPSGGGYDGAGRPDIHRRPGGGVYDGSRHPDDKDRHPPSGGSFDGPDRPQIHRGPSNGYDGSRQPDERDRRPPSAGSYDGPGRPGAHGGDYDKAGYPGPHGGFDGTGRPYDGKRPYDHEGAHGQGGYQKPVGGSYEGHNGVTDGLGSRRPGGSEFPGVSGGERPTGSFPGGGSTGDSAGREPSEGQPGRGPMGGFPGGLGGGVPGRGPTGDLPGGSQTGGLPGRGPAGSLLGEGPGGFPGRGPTTGGQPGGQQPGGLSGANATEGTAGTGGVQTSGFPGGEGAGGADGVGDLCSQEEDCKGSEESQVQTSVTQDGNATRALSSAQGRFKAGIAQAQVSGIYTGSGSFSAQAQTSDNDKGAQVQVIGGSRGASSSAQGMGGRGQTQAQVQLGSKNGATSAEAQSGGLDFVTNTQVQAGAKGGSADAQADGPGRTSSQAQIGFTPYVNKTEKEKEQKVPFQGGVSASAQSGANVGQSQTELFGSFYDGISYTGSAQAGSGKAIGKLKQVNSTLAEGTDNDKQSMTQLGFSNRRGLPPLPKFGQGILKGFKVDDLEEEKIDSKKSNVSGEVPDLVKETSEKKATVTTGQNNPKTGGNYFKEKSKPQIDKDAEILETKEKDQNKEEDEENDDEYDEEAEEEEYDESADLKAKPVKYTAGKGIETPYGSVVEKDETITVNQKSPTQSQTVFIGGLDKKHDVHIEQDADESVKEGDVLEPGDTILGKEGFTVPQGFRGKVTSVAGQIGKTRAAAPDGGRAQSQTVLVKPGTGKVHYTNPKPYKFEENGFARSSPYANQLSTLAKLQNEKVYHPPYASSSIVNNGQKRYSQTYYTKSSGCGYYTFSCDVVFGSNGRAKICKPNPPTNPDGTPCVI